MDGERSINRNVLIPCKLIVVVTVLLHSLKALLCVMKCGKAYLQREWDLFNELHVENDTSEWDREGLFLAFIKGEDIRGRRAKKSSLKLKAKKNTNARIISGNALTSTAKRPVTGELFLRGLILRAPLRVHSGVYTMKNTAHTCDHTEPNDCSMLNVSVSDACVSLTNNIVSDANQFRSMNGDKDHTTTTPLSWMHQVTRQTVVSSVVPESEVNCHEDASVPCSHGTALDLSNAGGEVTFQEIERASPGVVDKRKKRSEGVSVVPDSSQDNVEKKVSSLKHSSSHVDKEEKGSNVVSLYCPKQKVGLDKSNKVISPRIERSSFGVNKGKKRSIAASASCFNEAQRSEQVVKKPRKGLLEAHLPRKIRQPLSFRKIIKDKECQKSRSKRVRQRKLTVSRRLSFIGQPDQMKTSPDPANTKAAQFDRMTNANLPSQAAIDQAQTTVQYAFEGLLNAKRPLPRVTPFCLGVQPAAESMELLPTTATATELVPLMEQLPIASPVDPVCDVPDACDSYSDDESDAEYDVYPESQSLPEQVLQLIQLLA